MGGAVEEETWMVEREEGPGRWRRRRGLSRERLDMFRYLVVGVRVSDGVGGGSVRTPEVERKGLVGVLMLRPPQRGQRYLSTVVCWPDGLEGREPGLPTRRGW